MKIEKFETGDLTDPKYITPVSINYVQNGIEKRWEAVKSHDSVAVLLFHKEKNVRIAFKPASKRGAYPATFKEIFSVT